MKAQFLTPVVTVFENDGITPSWEETAKVHDFLIENGMDGLVLMGSTGEFFSMSMETQKAYIDFAAKTLTGRTRIFIGTTRMNLAETIELTNYSVSKGLNEVMIVSPYYFRLPETSLEKWYSQIAEHTDAHIFLYNFPDRTGHDLTPELVVKLAQKYPNIVGIKDTVTPMNHTSNILSTVLKIRPDFEVFSGFDDNLIHNIAGGGAGCIGGLSNLIPEKCSAWTRSIREGDFKAMSNWQQYFNDAMALYNICTPFIPAVKYAMNLRGLGINETCSAPILPPNKSQKKQLQKLLEKLNIKPL